MRKYLLNTIALLRISIFGMILIAVFWIVRGLGVNAQTNLNVHVSYEALSYAPAEYLLHALPPLTARAPFRLSAAMWNEDANGTVTLLNPQDYIFKWYLNDRALVSGVGKNTAHAVVPSRTTAPQRIRLRIEDSKGRLVSVSTVSIPVSKPLVGIFAAKETSASRVAKDAFVLLRGSKQTFVAQPFFLNVPSLDRLDFRWNHAGQAITAVDTTNPQALTITVSQNAYTGQRETFGITITNRVDTTETVNKNFNVIIQ